MAEDGEGMSQAFENGYPPAPWQLRGQLHASAFLVPATAVPLDQVPPGYRPVRLGRCYVVGTAWVSYEPGGVLSYRELMATVLVRRGRRLMPCITRIWVDSDASRAGGRALWGIPKELAEFRFDADRAPRFGEVRGFAAREPGPGGAQIATGTVRRLLGLPGRWPLRFRVAQVLGGRALLTPVRARARLELARGRFAADASGPLAFLRGRRALIGFTLRDFAMRFGEPAGASGPGPVRGRAGDPGRPGVQ